MDFLWVNLLGVQSNYQQGKSRNMKYSVTRWLLYNVGPLAANAIKVLYFIPFHFTSSFILGLAQKSLTVPQKVIEYHKCILINVAFWKPFDIFS